MFYLPIENVSKTFLKGQIVCRDSMQNHTRNSIRKANTCDPAFKLLNKEITSDIQKHKQTLWQEQLDAHWDHRHTTHIRWTTTHDRSNWPPPPTLNTSITFNNKITTAPKHIANCFTKQFTNTVKHKTSSNYHSNK